MYSNFLSACFSTLLRPEKQKLCPHTLLEVEVQIIQVLTQADIMVGRSQQGETQLCMVRSDPLGCAVVETLALWSSSSTGSVSRLNVTDAQTASAVDFQLEQSEVKMNLSSGCFYSGLNIIQIRFCGLARSFVYVT